MDFAEKVERAIQQNDIEYIKHLIKEGIDINRIYTLGDYYYDRSYYDIESVYFDYQVTLLSMAISSQKLEIIQLLLDSGANPNMKVEGVTPLRHALNWNYLDIAEMLVKAGAGFDEIMVWDDYCHIEKFMFIAAKQRIKLFKEELIQKAWHPKRMDAWIEAGALDMMIGC